MKLFVGLGNPGVRYAGNRHNIGFMAAEAIAREHDFASWRRRFQGQTCEGRLGGDKVALLCPETFMNRSGQAVGEAMRFFKLSPAEVTVFHDELDLAPGKMRVKTGGGHAGHNGLRSIASHIGPDFTRIRLGIGHPGDRNRVSDYVLSDFAKADRAWLEPLIDAVACESPLLVTDGTAVFQQAVARRLAPPPEAKSAAPAPRMETGSETPTRGVFSGLAGLADRLRGRNQT